MKISTQTFASPKGQITLYTLTNAQGASVTLSTVGAGIVAVKVPDRDGQIDDVLLGYDNPASYFYDGPCAGKVPGRYANRIAGGRFTLDGTTYQLNINNGPNSLHGGPEGFSHKLWQGQVRPGGVRFTLNSPDGDEHFPGNLVAGAEYAWSDDNQLTLVLMAQCDKPTVVNLTNHAYWNLDGENSGSALDQTLWLNASRYLPTDSTLIPTGEFAPVAGTPMDFTRPKRLGQDIGQDFPALKYGKGYDNCWAIDHWQPGKMQLAARLEAARSGRVLQVFTTQPAVQVYTGNWLAGCPANKGGHRPYRDYEGVAIECQGMPDAPNHPQFPSQVLRPGETYQQTIVFELKIKN